MNIIKFPNQLLKTKCEAVSIFDDALKTRLDEMRNVMIANKGMGLSANQVEILSRFFIMKDLKGEFWEFINPEILGSDGNQYQYEGCLSAPGISVQIQRPEEVHIKAQNRNGEWFEVVAYGMEAVCILHEMEHLEGVFFLEKTNRQQRRAALKYLGIKD